MRLSGVRRGRYGSPGLLRALELGADVSVVALSKYWGGHSDLLAGGSGSFELHSKFEIPARL